MSPSDALRAASSEPRPRHLDTTSTLKLDSNSTQNSTAPRQPSTPKMLVPCVCGVKASSLDTRQASTGLDRGNRASTALETASTHEVLRPGLRSKCCKSKCCKCCKYKCCNCANLNAANAANLNAANLQISMLQMLQI